MRAKFLIITLACLFHVGIVMAKKPKPNVILIMADDMGYECLGINGSIEYRTPHLDKMAEEGMLFTKCISQPLCTPSRVKIMTGRYNYRNYDYFGNLNVKEYTFGNLMKDAGYATCVAGKWQLNGINSKDEVVDWADKGKPNKFGFDEYCLWQLTMGKREGERYADPLIEQNGEFLERDKDAYGPDIFVEYILGFIDRKQAEPFFVYYPMVLVHDPFVPTPGSDDWANKELRYKNDTSYFKDMVEYTDKIVGRIYTRLQELNRLENTILIFTGDNGTHRSICTSTKEGIVTGGKGKTINTGIHVPLIIHWPNMHDPGRIHDGLIEFSDFFPTLAELVNKEVDVDGRSFYTLLTGGTYKERETAFVHYDPHWGFGNQFRNQFAMTEEYKLYRDGFFYHYITDPFQENPLDADALDENQMTIKKRLEEELKDKPGLKD